MRTTRVVVVVAVVTALAVMAALVPSAAEAAARPGAARVARPRSAPPSVASTAEAIPQPMALGSLVTGHLDVPGAELVYTFTATAGQRVIADVVAGSGIVDSWNLREADGSTIFNGGFYDTGQTYTLAAGLHTLTITGNPGDVEFRIWSVPASQSFALALGTPVSDGAPSAGAGRLESPGSQDVYTFTATAGQTILAERNSGSTKSWVLRSPDGTVVFDGSMSTTGTPYVLTAGQHTLTVTGDAGPYGFTVSSVPTGQTFPLALGTAVSDGVPSSGAGRLESPGARDAYTFTATAGQRIMTTVDSSTGTKQWNLRGPDGAVVFDSYLSGSGDQAFVLVAGQHTLTVTGDPGPYGFKVWSVPSAQTFPLTPGTSVSDGAPAAGAGRLESPGAADVYTFTATAGQRIVGRRESATTTKNWTLRAPDGRTVFDTTLGDTPTPLVLVAGQYTLTVTGDPGPYGFRVSTVPDPQPFALTLGTSVSDGVPSAGAGRLESAGAEDVYTFTATAGQKVTAVTESGSGPSNWNLRGPDGSIVFDTCWCTPTGPFLLAAGVYTLTVSGEPGPYGFKVALSAATPVAAGPTTTAFATSIGASVSTDVPAAGAGVVAKGEQDVYAFAATAGQVVWLRSDSGDGYSRYTLRSPDGSQLASGYSTSDVGEVRLPATGTYRIYATNLSSTPPVTSSYGFTILAGPAPQVFPISVGTTVSDGAPSAGAGRLESIGARDRYTFTASVGDRVRIADLTDGNPGEQLELRSPAGRLIDTERLDGNDAIGVETLPLTGTYTIEVAGPGTSRTTGAYSFSLVAAPSPETFAISVGTAVSDGVPSVGAGHIEAPGSTDAYTFTGTAGQRVWFDDTSDASTGFRWTVRAPDGTAFPSENLDGYDQALGLRTLPQTGTYTMVVQAPAPSRTTGTYGFKIWTVPATESFTLAIDATVSDGQPAAGAGRIESPGAIDRYQFSGTVGQRLWFDNLTDQNHSLYWELRAPDGTEIFDSPLNTSTDPGPITLPATGTYRIRVHSDTLVAGSGAYSFVVHQAATVQTFAIPVGTAVSDGQPAAGAGRLESVGSQDVYTFTGTAGQSVWFDDRTDQANSLRWVLRNPDGTTLFDQNLQGSDPGLRRLPRSGTYRVEVSSSLDHFGPYAFTLWAGSAQDFTITPGATVTNGTPAAGAGNIESPGAIDRYSFTGNAGQVFRFENLTGVNHSLAWRLRDPNGLTMFDAGLSPGATVANQILPYTGTYSIEVRAQADTSGIYSIRISAQGADTSKLPRADDFELELNPDATVGTNTPQPGMGLLGGSGSVDLYHFAGESGQAASFKVTAGCTSSQRWVLRDPTGATVFDDYLCSQQTVVLPDAGTYTLSVGGGSAGALYGFTIWTIESRREPAKPGQTPPAATLRSIQPSTAAAGGTATVSVLAQHMARPTALKVSKGATTIPIEEATFRSALTSIDSPVAVTRLDLSGAPNGSYDVAVTLADGSVKTLTAAFTVTGAVEPVLDLHVDGRPTMRVGAVSRAFVTAVNNSASDYYGAFVNVTVPCGTSAKAELPPFPTTAYKQALADRGAPASVLANADKIALANSAPARPTPDGTCHINVDIPKVATGEEVTFPVTVQPTKVGSGTISVGTVVPAPTPSDPTPATGGHALKNGPGEAEVVMRQRVEGAVDVIDQPKPSQAEVDEDNRVLRDAIIDGTVTVLSDEASIVAIGGALVWLSPDLATFGLAMIAAAPEIALAIAVIGLVVGLALIAFDFFQSRDPNEIIGTRGRGKAHGVAAGDRLTYTIYFENKSTASAAAQFVRVKMPLDADLDLSTLRFEAAGVGGHAVALNSTSATSMTGGVDLALNGGTHVAVGGSVKATTRMLDVSFAGPPGLNDPFAPTPYKDFLPPNTTSPNGEGFVRISVQSKKALPYGTQVKAKATVYFDEHENGGTSLDTNEWVNTVSPPWSPFGSWSTFVDRQYKDLMGRAATVAERNAAVAKLTAGAASGSIPGALRRSGDATGTVDPVTRLYSAYFLRIPDASGLTYWIGKKRAGTSLDTVSAGFATSAEFKRRYGTLTNNAFVKQVYLNVLGRAGDAAGIAYWTNQLDKKLKTRGQVMIGYSNSGEYKKAQASEVDVSVAYVVLLGRAPTPAEFAAAVKALDGGTPLATLLTTILDSVEYETRVTT